MLVSSLINDSVRQHGKELFRLRKGPARESKAVCEEAVPLGNLLTAEEFSGWQVRLGAPGDKADGWLRERINAVEFPIQIVAALDGVDFSADMRTLNRFGSTSIKVGSASEIEDGYTDLVNRSIQMKDAKRYPAGYWLLIGVEELNFSLRNMTSLAERAADVARGTQFDRVYLAGLELGGGAKRVK